MNRILSYRTIANYNDHVNGADPTFNSYNVYHTGNLQFTLSGNTLTITIP
jgi:hypothetical protein